MTARREKLKETAVVALLVAAIVGLATLAFGEPSIVWESHRSLAQLKMPRWSGSGTLIAIDNGEDDGISEGKGLILSCRHVAYREGTTVELNWVSSGQKTTGVVTRVVPANKPRRKSSWHNDLALIEADIPAGVVPVPVVKFDPNNGPWTCRGFRSGTAYTAVTNKAKIENGALVLGALFWGGESGGAVLDKYGQLVGVIVASQDGDGSIGIAANGEALQELLEGYGKQYLD